VNQVLKQLEALTPKTEKRKERIKFCCSADLFKVYGKALSELHREVFIVIGLDCKNGIVGETLTALGSIDECRIDSKELFRSVLKMDGALRIVLIHNHPSGDCTPSPSDLTLTERLTKCAELLGFTILDHLIIGDGSYLSMRDMGLL
jgi:DNA repair protein RadC